MPLANIETDYQPQGRPQLDYTYQLEQFKSHLYSLPPRHAVVARAGHPTVIIKAPFVEDPFDHVEIRPYLIRALEEKLRSIHDYYETVDDLDAANEQRLDEFIAHGIGVQASQVPNNTMNQPSPANTIF